MGSLQLATLVLRPSKAWGIVAAIFAALLLVLLPVASASTGPTYSWTQIAGSTEVTDNLFALAWDPAGYEIALATNSTGVVHTYGFENDRWVNLHVRTPQPYVNGAGTFETPGTYLVYDSALKTMLLLATFELGSPVVLTWELVGQVWEPFHPSHSAPSSYNYWPNMIYDSSDNSVILYAGDFGECDCETNDLWALQAGTWHELAAAPTGAGSVVYVPWLGGLVTLGSHAWILKGGKWSEITVMHHPTPEDIVIAVYDPHLRAEVFTVVPPSGIASVKLWQAQTDELINITSKTVDSEVVCSYGPNYDPSLQGLVCAGATSLNEQVNGVWLFV
jgi:hypothetical protein